MPKFTLKTLQAVLDQDEKASAGAYSC